jgi:purine-binding chemotaxis protein CheW
MSTGVSLSSSEPAFTTVQEMRRTFDQAFASASAAATEMVERLLLVQVGAKPFVIRNGDISGLAKAKRIVPAPSRHPELVGIAGIRGVLIPVFNLAKLVGLEARSEELHWLALVTGEQSIALAFDEFEGQADVAHEAIYSQQNAAESKHNRLLAHVGSSVRPVVDVPGIFESIRKSAGS